MDQYLDRLRRQWPHLYAWEKDYRTRGSLWRGSSEIDLKPHLKKGSKVLEVGCGNGKTAKALAMQGFKVVGIDVSPTATELAKKECPEGVFELGNATGLKFKRNSFDAVVLWHVLDHLLLAERKKAVKEGKRVLKNGGVIAFQGFSTNDMRFGNGVEVQKNTFRKGNNVYYHYFTASEVKKLFEGLQVIQVGELMEKKRFAHEAKRAVVRFMGRKE